MAGNGWTRGTSNGWWFRHGGMDHPKVYKFPQDTAGNVIIVTIKEKLKEVDAEIEEYFAYGRYADAGGVRFMKEDDLWSYLKSHSRDLNFDRHGQKLSLGADKVRGEVPREKAIRKLVRTVTEANGGMANR